jgi:ABC-type sugar transport system substrate-binding protein
MGQQLPAGSKVAGAVGELISQTGQARKEGFLEGASQAGLEVLAFEEGTGWTQDGGYTMGQSILSSFPDLQGIFGGDDLGALGVHDAAVEAGRRDGLLIAGVDGLQKGRDGVADGSLDMSVMLIGGHREAAIGVIDMLEALVRGDTHGDAMDAMHFIKSLVVTKESLAEPWGVLI